VRLTFYNIQGVMMIERIISGGQTGADRAGINAAIESGIPYGR
jgi:hypothetical protein